MARMNDTGKGTRSEMLRGGLTSQQCEHGLGCGVSLRQSCQRCLLQHLRLGEVGGFCRHVGVSNTGLRRRVVGDLGLGEVNGVGEFVFAGSDFSLYRTEIGDRGLQRGESRDCVTGIGGGGTGRCNGFCANRPEHAARSAT